MLNQSGERTLVSAIIPPNVSHIITLFGMCFRSTDVMLLVAANMSSIVYDGLIKIINRSDFLFDTAGSLRIADNTKFNNNLRFRILLLNCLTNNYSKLWYEAWNIDYVKDPWTKSDSRLLKTRFVSLTPEWTWSTPLRTDFERRQALVEIDVLTAMSLGMTLDQLKTIYRIQFPVLQQYEADTWYDQNGRIVFTNNRSLTGVGLDRKTWETIKDMPSGTFSQEIEDDTLPTGKVIRTITYFAPFDKCDREQDYDTAWTFFENKYGKQ